MASTQKPSGGQKKSLDAQASSFSLPSKRKRVSTKKPLNGKKKPLDEQASSLPLAGTKQVSVYKDFGLLATNERMISNHFNEQSNEYLNDVTAFSGIDLEKEEELLVSGPKVKESEASRKCVQSEDKPILEKVALQKKLTKIITKSGLKNWSNDVEQCLSLCIERRLRDLISSPIEDSKQRVDSHKSTHATVVTSDIREQILAINQKAREELQKKQAEAEKQNELPSRTIVGADEENDEEYVQPLKMKNGDFGLTAANVAARASLGMDDLLSRWKLMGQAHQIHEDATNRLITTSDANARGTQENAVVRQTSRNQVAAKPSRPHPHISVKDVISVLEREPQMAKSTVLYKLYDRMRAEPATK